MVKRFSSAFGSGNSYTQIFSYPGLPDEIIEIPGAEAVIQGRIFFISFAGYDALYFRSPSLFLGYYTTTTNIYYEKITASGIQRRLYMT
jgi:hypothetical protein